MYWNADAEVVLRTASSIGTCCVTWECALIATGTAVPAEHKFNFSSQINYRQDMFAPDNVTLCYTLINFFSKRMDRMHDPYDPCEEAGCLHEI